MTPTSWKTKNRGNLTICGKVIFMNANTLKVADLSLAVIGLGYVGLPLAILSTNKGFDTTGVDIDSKRLGII